MITRKRRKEISGKAIPIEDDILSVEDTNVETTVLPVAPTVLALPLTPPRPVVEETMPRLQPSPSPMAVETPPTTSTISTAEIIASPPAPPLSTPLQINSQRLVYQENLTLSALAELTTPPPSNAKTPVAPSKPKTPAPSPLKPKTPAPTPPLPNEIVILDDVPDVVRFMFGFE